MAAADSSPPMPTRAGQSPTHPTEALLPSNSSPFPFSCTCTNLTVNARVANDISKEIDSGLDQGKVRVYLPVAAENQASPHSYNRRMLALMTRRREQKLPGYVTYDHARDPQDLDEDEDEDEGDRDAEEAVSDDAGPSWRKCWLCGVGCYQAKGKGVGEGAIEEGWVIVDLASGIVYGDKLDQIDPQRLPFSGLKLDNPSSSNFGRPPHHVVPTIYPPVADDKDAVPLITPPHDPFFLPPPFIPSHSHLRDLCNSASDYLRDSHTRLENDVKAYIALKAKEMRDLEDQVRGEVELLWTKYTEGPGQHEEIHRGRSASTSRSRSRSRQRDAQKPLDTSPNPIAKVAASINTTAPGASLLAQSLSANTFYGPQPTSRPSPVAKDQVDATIDEVSKTYGKKDDSRAVAMSFVFSSLAENMGSSTVGQSRRRSSSRATEEEPEPVRAAVPNKDSWIDEERLLAIMRSEDKKRAIDVEEDEGPTPRPRSAQQKRDEKQNKGKGKVTFEEPEEEAKVEESDQEDYVFDFELDDKKEDEEDEQGIVGSREPKPSLAHLPISRTRNMVEANLSRTFAADAPSHRAAWKRIQENGSMYASLRRGSSEDEDEESSVDESKISQLAMSVPVAINLPKQTRSASGVPAFERKTSLSEREGVLVPPLMAAMRQRGMLPMTPQRSTSATAHANATATASGGASPRGRTLTTNGNKKQSLSHRAASASREREQVKSYAADPGAIFESLADERAGDEQEEEEGTLRDNKGFVPPHLLVRKEDKQAGDVGWRSMINE